jgi:hypothetical protein
MGCISTIRSLAAGQRVACRQSVFSQRAPPPASDRSRNGHVAEATPPEILDSYPIPLFFGGKYIWLGLSASASRNAEGKPECAALGARGWSQLRESRETGASIPVLGPSFDRQ